MGVLVDTLSTDQRNQPPPHILDRMASLGHNTFEVNSEQKNKAVKQCGLEGCPVTPIFWYTWYWYSYTILFDLMNTDSTIFKEGGADK